MRKVRKCAGHIQRVIDSEELVPASYEKKVRIAIKEVK